jgi:catechol 2,3-dioxygenase-like lactoylglutathione lyase family enzyme
MMLTDQWDISHICLAVDDLDAAMESYTAALGMEWGTVIDFAHMPLVGDSDVHEGGVSHDGLRAVLSRNGGPVSAGLPFASLELAAAAPGSPAFRMWGCRDRGHYVHHLAFWVDDFDAETRQLAAQGFDREMYIDLGGGAQVAYYTSRAGLRLELQDAAFKPAAAQFLATGKLELG